MWLIDTKTGKVRVGEIERATSVEINDLQTENRFVFDWVKETDKEIYKLTLFGVERIIGLMAISDIPDELRIHIHLIESSKENRGRNKLIENIPGCLITFACMLSFRNGYGGFVSLYPKTQLIKYYKETYGFRQIGRMLAVDFEDSKAIITRYSGHEEI